MDTHKNARLTPKGREEMVRAVLDRGMSNAATAHQFNTTPKTVGKWVGRFCAEGVDGLCDRSSRPLSSPSQIPLATTDGVENLRRERRTQEHIAAEIGHVGKIRTRAPRRVRNQLTDRRADGGAVAGVLLAEPMRFNQEL